jgi:hypothetical protein
MIAFSVLHESRNGVLLLNFHFDSIKLRGFTGPPSWNGTEPNLYETRRDIWKGRSCSPVGALTPLLFQYVICWTGVVWLGASELQLDGSFRATHPSGAAYSIRSPVIGTALLLEADARIAT